MHYFTTGEGADSFTISTDSPGYWRTDSKYRAIGKAEGERLMRAESLRALRRLRIKPGATIWTQVTHVSASGMSRRVQCYIVHKGAIVRIGHDVARVINRPYGDNGIRFDGCGYSVEFEAVYSLGQALWPKGTRRPHSSRNGEPDSTGGYALNQRSL